MAFGDTLEEYGYLALLAVLAEHMCEENIGITVARQFGRDAVKVTNDLAKVQSVQPPHGDAVKAVRVRLEEAGFEQATPLRVDGAVGSPSRRSKGASPRRASSLPRSG